VTEPHHCMECAGAVSKGGALFGLAAAHDESLTKKQREVEAPFEKYNSVLFLVSVDGSTAGREISAPTQHERARR
jgi:hypothetical protein